MDYLHLRQRARTESTAAETQSNDVALTIDGSEVVSAQWAANATGSCFWKLCKNFQEIICNFLTDMLYCFSQT